MHGLNSKFKWPDGKSYEGEYKQDKRNGWGVFKLVDGRKYYGQWKDGLKHGKMSI